MSVHHTPSGQEVHLAERLGGGGEGTVYAVRGRPTVVAKIYNSAMSGDREQKLRAMVALGTPQLAAITAWPSELILSGCHVIGFIMPRAIEAQEAHVLYGPKSRKQSFPNASYSFLVGAAANVARAFATVHDNGIVVGDVNDRLAMIAQSGVVRLIDCDSFQLMAGSTKFLCDVGVDNFTPPELQGLPYRNLERTRQHDNFGLAVLLFHLLFLGRHPFAGRHRGAAHLEIPDAIKQHRFAYSSEKQRTATDQPPNTPTLVSAGTSIAQMFERAFAPDAASGKSQRPSADDWVEALEGLFKRLVKCRENGVHAYDKSLPDCPWCKIELQTRIELFNYVQPEGSTTTAVDVDAIWQAIEGMSSFALRDTPQLLSIKATLSPSREVALVKQGAAAAIQVQNAEIKRRAAEANVKRVERELANAQAGETAAKASVDAFEVDKARLPALLATLARANQLRSLQEFSTVASWIAFFGALLAWGQKAPAVAIPITIIAALCWLSFFILQSLLNKAGTPAKLKSDVQALQTAVELGLSARENVLQSAITDRQSAQNLLLAAQASAYNAMVEENDIRSSLTAIVHIGEQKVKTLNTAEQQSSQRYATAQLAHSELRKELSAIFAEVHRLRGEAQRNVAQIQQLEIQRTEEHRAATNNAHQSQLAAFLDRFFITKHPWRIPKSVLSGLSSYGIETAADITRTAVEAVPGFGPVRTSELVNWRQEKENQFQFDPTTSDRGTRIQAANRRRNAERHPLERHLIKIKVQIEAQILPHHYRSTSVETELANAALTYAQALVDAEALRSPAKVSQSKLSAPTPTRGNTQTYVPAIHQPQNTTRWHKKRKRRRR
jgi:DNA-binding helix-hairpin-helix protein with protein kinase domain